MKKEGKSIIRIFQSSSSYIIHHIRPIALEENHGELSSDEAKNRTRTKCTCSLPAKSPKKQKNQKNQIVTEPLIDHPHQRKPSH